MADPRVQPFVRQAPPIDPDHPAFFSRATLDAIVAGIETTAPGLAIVDFLERRAAENPDFQVQFDAVPPWARGDFPTLSQAQSFEEYQTMLAQLRELRDRQRAMEISPAGAVIGSMVGAFLGPSLVTGPGAVALGTRAGSLVGGAAAGAALGTTLGAADAVLRSRLRYENLTATDVLLDGGIMGTFGAVVGGYRGFKAARAAAALPAAELAHSSRYGALGVRIDDASTDLATTFERAREEEVVSPDLVEGLESPPPKASRSDAAEVLRDIGISDETLAVSIAEQVSRMRAPAARQWEDITRAAVTASGEDPARIAELTSRLVSELEMARGAPKTLGRGRTAVNAAQRIRSLAAGGAVHSAAELALQLNRAVRAGDDAAVRAVLDLVRQAERATNTPFVRRPTPPPPGRAARPRAEEPPAERDFAQVSEEIAQAPDDAAAANAVAGRDWSALVRSASRVTADAPRRLLDLVRPVRRLMGRLSPVERAARARDLFARIGRRREEPLVDARTFDETVDEAVKLAERVEITGRPPPDMHRAAAVAATTIAIAAASAAPPPVAAMALAVAGPVRMLMAARGILVPTRTELAAWAAAFLGAATGFAARSPDDPELSGIPRFEDIAPEVAGLVLPAVVLPLGVRSFSARLLGAHGFDPELVRHAVAAVGTASKRTALGRDVRRIETRALAEAGDEAPKAAGIVRAFDPVVVILDKGGKTGKSMMGLHRRPVGEWAELSELAAKRATFLFPRNPKHPDWPVMRSWLESRGYKFDPETGIAAHKPAEWPPTPNSAVYRSIVDEAERARLRETTEAPKTIRRVSDDTLVPGKSRGEQQAKDVPWSRVHIGRVTVMLRDDLPVPRRQQVSDMLTGTQPVIPLRATAHPDLRHFLAEQAGGDSIWRGAKELARAGVRRVIAVHSGIRYQSGWLVDMEVVDLASMRFEGVRFSRVPVIRTKVLVPGGKGGIDLGALRVAAGQEVQRARAAAKAKRARAETPAPRAPDETPQAPPEAREPEAAQSAPEETAQPASEEAAKAEAPTPGPVDEQLVADATRPPEARPPEAEAFVRDPETGGGKPPEEPAAGGGGGEEPPSGGGDGAGTTGDGAPPPETPPSRTDPFAQSPLAPVIAEGDLLKLVPAAWMERLRISPFVRLVQSPIPRARLIAWHLAQSPGLQAIANRMGFATPVSVETARKMDLAGMARAVMETERLYTRFVGLRVQSRFQTLDLVRANAVRRFRSGAPGEPADAASIRSYRDFRREVGKAMLRGDEHPVKEVAEAAKIWRAELERVREAAHEVDLFAMQPANAARAFRARARNLEWIIRRGFSGTVELDLTSPAFRQFLDPEHFGLKRIASEDEARAWARRLREAAERAEKAAENARKSRGDLRGADASYFPRRWNVQAILRNRERFEQIILEHLEQTGKPLTRVDPETGEEIDVVKEIVEAIVDREPFTRVTEDATGLATGFHARALPDLPTERVLDFVHLDVELVLRHHLATAWADIHLTRRFGSPNLYGVIDLLKRDIAAAQLPPREGEAILRDVRALRDRLRGTYGMPENPYHTLWRSLRSIRQVNAMLYLGLAPISAFVDVARPVMAYGLEEVMRPSLRRLERAFEQLGRRLDGLPPLEQARWREEAELAGAALETVMLHRASAMADSFDAFGKKTWLERSLAVVHAGYFRALGLTQWTDMMKSWATMVAASRVAELAGKVAAGEQLPEKLRGILARAHLDDDMLRRVHAQIREHGERDGPIVYPNTAAWTDAEAMRVFRAAIVDEADRVIITPGIADIPLFMSKEWGATIAQFRRFGIAATLRLLQGGIQDGQARAFLVGAALAIFAGYMSGEIKAIVQGRPSFGDRATKIGRAIELSAILGIFTDIDTAVESAIGIGAMSTVFGAPPFEPSASVALGQFLGPTVRTAASVYGVLEDWAVGRHDWTTARNLRKLTFGQNLWYLARIMNEIEAAIR